MQIYIILLLTALFGYSILKYFKGGNLFYYKMMFFLMAFVSTFRHEIIGADYRNYIDIFRSIQMYGIKYPHYGKGYVLLNMIAGFFSQHYVSLAVCINILFFSCAYRYYLKYVNLKKIYIVVIILIANPYLYIQSSFNILRQSCATAILMIGIMCLNKKDIYRKDICKYICLVLIAAQFHSIAYVFLLLLPFKMIDWNKHIFTIIATITLLMNLLLSNDSFMAKIASIFGYGSYIGYGKTEFDFPMFAIFIYIVILFLLNSVYEKITDTNCKFFLDLYIFSLSILSVLVKNDIAYRVYIILTFLSLPAIPITLNMLYKGNKKFNYYVCLSVYVLYYLLLFSLFLYNMKMGGNTSYVPFKFFWE